ncbi:hypothetical protein U1Q18_034375 [Sarracenia purpurea var. burkii]
MGRYYFASSVEGRDPPVADRPVKRQAKALEGWDPPVADRPAKRQAKALVDKDWRYARKHILRISTSGRCETRAISMAILASRSHRYPETTSSTRL